MNIEKIKLIAFDIDGTILPYDEKELRPEIKKMFERLKKAGYYTAVATGREFITIGDLLENLKCDFFIGANGSFCVDLKTKKIIYEQKIDYKSFLKLKSFFLKNGMSVNIMSDNFAYFSKDYEINDWFLGDHKEKFQDLEEVNEKTTMHLITIKTNFWKDEEKFQKTVDFLEKNPDINATINSRWSKGFFISPKKINKFTTLNWLSNFLGFSPKNIIAFGDSSNDVEMIKNCGLGIAMENADIKVKKVAKEIALNCQENGTIKKLEQLKII